ncbi:MAG: hypothetical protein ACPHER_02180 [Nevskiales bacterium]
MNRLHLSLLYFLTALLIPLLTACPESDGDGNSDGRVQIALSQVHAEHDHEEDEEDHDHEEAEECHEHEEGEEGHEHEEAEECHEHEEGEDHEHEEGEEDHEHDTELEDAAGHVVELHSAYVVLDQFQLIECSSITATLKRSLQGLIGQAFAADGHNHDHDHGSDRPEVPDDQRNLNRPHVIDLASESEESLVLGNARIVEGQYCDLRLSIVPAADDAFGLPEDLSMNGIGFYFDFEQDIDGEISERVVDSTGMALPHTVTLRIEEPLVVSANTQHLVIGLHLAHLFEEIDLSTATDAEVRAALLEGLAGALEIIDQGAGEIE